MSEQVDRSAFPATNFAALVFSHSRISRFRFLPLAYNAKFVVLIPFLWRLSFVSAVVSL